MISSMRPISIPTAPKMSGPGGRCSRDASALDFRSKFDTNLNKISSSSTGIDTQTRIKASLIGLMELDLLKHRQMALVSDARASLRRPELKGSQQVKLPGPVPVAATHSIATNIAELKENMEKLNEESVVLGGKQTITGVEARLRELLSTCDNDDMNSETVSICTTTDENMDTPVGPLSPPTRSPSPEPRHQHTNLSKVLSLEKLPHRRDSRDSPSPHTRHSSTSSFAEMRVGSSASFASFDCTDDDVSIHDLLTHPSTSTVMRHPKSPWASESPIHSPERRQSPRDPSPGESTGCPSPDSFLSDSESAYTPRRGPWYCRSSRANSMPSIRSYAHSGHKPNAHILRRVDSSNTSYRVTSPTGSFAGTRLDLIPFRKLKKPPTLGGNGEILEYPNPIRAISLQSSACAGLLMEEIGDVVFTNLENDSVFYV